jgi:hypothetical protein
MGSDVTLELPAGVLNGWLVLTGGGGGWITGAGACATAVAGAGAGAAGVGAATVFPTTGAVWACATTAGDAVRGGSSACSRRTGAACPGSR